MGQRKKESIDYLYDILDAIVKIEKFTNGIGFDEFSKDYKTVYAVVRAFEIIGEASKRVSDSVKKKYENIPWREMAGMRDKLIHGYFGIDIKVIWKSVKEDVPFLKSLLLKIEEIAFKE